jgi:hypothetical protein
VAQFQFSELLLNIPSVPQKRPPIHLHPDDGGPRCVRSQAGQAVTTGAQLCTGADKKGAGTSTWRRARWLLVDVFDGIGLDLFASVLAPCSLGCSGTARPRPARVGSNRHDRPLQVGREGPSAPHRGADFFAADISNRAPVQRLPRRVSAGSRPAPRKASPCRRLIRRAARSLLTSGRC